MKAWFLPIHILLYTLTLLALGASFSWNGTDPFLWFISLRNFSLILLAGYGTTFILNKLELATWSRSEHRIITALILFLLFDSLTPLWVFPLVGMVTELLQRLLRTPLGPLFNPAALGALVMSFLGYFPSWWGTNFSPRFPAFGESMSIALLLTLPFAGYVVYKYKKHWISIAALAGFSAAYFFIFQENPLFMILDGTLLFFLLVMAVEPKTSPNMLKGQVFFGVLIGILLPLGIRFHVLEAYTMALLIGNLYIKREFLRSLLFSSAKTEA